MTRLNETHDPKLKRWVAAAHQVAAEHDLVVPRQHGERAEVEDLMVEGTKRKLVGARRPS